MIKNLFTKREHRSVPGVSKEQAMQAASWFWRSRQFGVNFTAPYSLRCEQFYSKLGLRQSVDVWATDEGTGTAVDISFSAELTDVGAVAGVATAVIFLPVTVAVGAVSYIEYENDAQRLMAEFWSYLSTFPQSQQPPKGPAPLPTWAQGQPAQPTVSQHPQAATPRPCPKCGAPVEPGSAFCRFCGARL